MLQKAVPLMMSLYANTDSQEYPSPVMLDTNWIDICLSGPPVSVQCFNKTNLRAWLQDQAGGGCPMGDAGDGGGSGMKPLLDCSTMMLSAFMRFMDP